MSYQLLTRFNTAPVSLSELAGFSSSEPKAERQAQPKPSSDLAAKFREMADAMEKAIQEKLNPAIGRQRPTARRARIAEGIRQTGYKMQKLQAALRALAKAHEAGNVPAILGQARTRAQVADLLADRETRAALEFLIKLCGEYQERTPTQVLLDELERKLIGQSIPGYFPTPLAIIGKMLDTMVANPTTRFLEPSAGKGSIAEQIRVNHPESPLTVLETDHTLREILSLKGFNLAGHDFLAHVGAYDAILMNPPFENGQDMDHIRHAFGCLAPGGRLVSVMAEGGFFRDDRKARQFRQWLENVGGHSEKLPAGSFLKSDRPTGVNTRLVYINKGGIPQ